jgi:hypothetical protein
MASPSRQLQLTLEPRRRWGGKRRGAGRKPGPLRRDPHRRRAPLAARHPCHVTLKVEKEVPSLRTAELVAELERSWRAACDRQRFRLVHYSIQNDHVHMIVEAASARDLACGLKAIAARCRATGGSIRPPRGAGSRAGAQARPGPPMRPPSRRGGHGSSASAGAGEV